MARASAITQFSFLLSQKGMKGIDQRIAIIVIKNFGDCHLDIDCAHNAASGALFPPFTVG